MQTKKSDSSDGMLVCESKPAIANPFLPKELRIGPGVALNIRERFENVLTHSTERENSDQVLSQESQIPSPERRGDNIN